MKQCAICSADIEQVQEPALLFIGQYGRQYELCPDCEKVMDTLVSSESSEERKAAADTVYHRFFAPESGRKSAELLAYFQSLFDEDGEAMTEARESLREYREEAEQRAAEAQEGNEHPSTGTEDTLTSTQQEENAEDEISEEDFLADKTPKTSLAVKLLFLLAFLLVGGGALAYGIWRSSVFTIVIGCIIILLGIASVFSKD